jgi:hypothetical protein
MLIAETNRWAFAQTVALLEKKLQFPRILTHNDLYCSLTINRVRVSCTFRESYFEHHWEVMFHADEISDRLKLIHKVQVYGAVSARDQGFPRNKVCLYGDYDQGCTWIFDADGDITSLSFDADYGYESRDLVF